MAGGQTEETTKDPSKVLQAVVDARGLDKRGRQVRGR